MFRHKRSADDFDAEVRSHLELEAEELQAEGCAETEARRRARVGFGSVEAARERFYERSHVMWIDNLLRDLRFALRSLKKNWKFASLAILALSLGIGSATVIFSAVYGVILNTFPFANPNQVTSFGIRDLSGPGGFVREYLAVPEFLDYRDQTRAFSDISGEYGGFNSTPVEYTAGENSFAFSADFMSVNSFGFFGVRPELGRLPSQDDTRAGATPVFMMSDKLWRRQFESDPHIVGGSFMLSGTARTLVGVMPPRFRWGWADLWIPFPIDRARVDADPQLMKESLWCVGRLRPGVTLQEAEADLDIVAHRMAKIDPHQYPNRFTVTATRLTDRVVGPFRELMYPLLGAVLLLLLIACSNVANLILTRATVRKKEMAVRAALGASRARMVQQFLMESLILAAAGCAVGCLLAYAGIRALVPEIPYNTFPQEAVITLNPAVLLFSLGIAMLATLLCSVVPAIRVLRDDPQFHLMNTSRGAGSQAAQGKGRSVLVVAEVALSIVLLIGTGLMARTFLALTHVNLGFSPDHVLAASLALPDAESGKTEHRNEFLSELLDRANALPGVDAAAESLAIPPYVGLGGGVTVPGSTHSEHWLTGLDLVSDGYFRTLDYHLLRGRLLSRGDVDLVRRVAVVNRAFVQRFFGDRDPVGRPIQFDLALTGPSSASAPKLSFEIIGVVENEQNTGLTNQPQPEAYLPFTLPLGASPNLLIRTEGDPAKLLPSLRHILWTLDPKVAVGDAASVRSILERDTFASPRFESMVLGAFALTGTLLVVIGIYSVMAYMVSLRTHEMGVRMALGAHQGNILRLVLGKGLVLIAMGTALGLLSSLALTRYLEHLVWGVSVRDPWTYAAVAIGVVAMGLASCFSPARRATKVNPATALRCDE
jgi:putative ABC transport system permease protein